MRIGVVGLGRVGLVSAACFAQIGHHVVGTDSMPEKLQDLEAGRLPFYEPHLEDLVRSGVAARRLRFDASLQAVVESSEVVFICVGTPTLPNGDADLSQIQEAAGQLAECMTGSYRVLVVKSTVPVTTGDEIRTAISRVTASPFDVVSNPEFLRQGSAVRDTLSPERIVIGCTSKRAADVMRRVYAPIVESSGCAMIDTDMQTAELIKHASNAFLATKISYINAVAEVCDQVGADVDVVAKGMGLDARIGPAFLDAGIGYGGSCFPKDVAAFGGVSQRLLGNSALLDAVRAINERAPMRLLAKLRSELPNLEGKRIAVLGLAFKPGTDDMRDSPAIPVIEELSASGAHVIAYDPVAMQSAKEILPPEVRFAAGPLDAMEDAHAVVITTSWPEFENLDPQAIKAALRLPIVADGRNLFAVENMAVAGLTYLSMGRPSA